MLRPYQIDAREQLRANYARGIMRQILKLPTGAGKTVVFSDLIQSAVAKGTKCVMAVAGRQLVDQASERLFRENVFHGVLMANHWNKKPGAPVQVCSIDTLNARSKYPFADHDGKVFVVVDECHLATSPKFKKFLEQYPRAHVLGVTATPWTREPLNHVGEVCVSPISMKELVAQNFLVPCRYFAPSTPDLKGVKKQNGDYVSSQLEERMNTLTGDIVSHWRTYADNRPTLLFACNIHHSESLVRAFNEAGIGAEHIEASDSFAKRKAAIDRLKRGEIRILSNVGVLCTGVDIPFVSCIIMARPTHSYNLFVQQAGRGTRICPETGKENFILLDHAGNVLRHGFIDDEPEVELGGRLKEKVHGDEPVRCKSCLQIYVRGDGPACPFCGASQSTGGGERTTAEQVDGILAEISNLPEAAQIQITFNRLKAQQKKFGLKRGWLFYQMRDRYGEDIANLFVPKRKVPPWLLGESHSAS
jgi:DNA repair protein RadD